MTAQIATTTKLTSATPAKPIFGQVVTLTAQVLPTLATGAVAFMDAGVLVGVGTLNSSGIAQATTLTLPAGPHSLLAVYGGNTKAGYLASQSLALSYIVKAVPGYGFAAAMNYPAGPYAISLAVGDFNGDGREDLAVANADGASVSVLLGNGNGKFQTAVNYQLGYIPRYVTVGDFNGDGKADLALFSEQAVPGNLSSGNGVSVLLGNGDGTFQAAVQYGGLGLCLAVGDFNGDGKADLALGIGLGVSVLLGNGDGTFQAAGTSSFTTAQPYSLAVGDFNGDGKVDLVVGDFFGGYVQVLLGNGDGTFQAAVNYFAFGPYSGSFPGPASVAVGDFNGDGKADLVVANFVSNYVQLLLGNGDGTFQAAVQYNAGTVGYSLTVGDFNGDGRADLAVAQPGGGYVSLGNGDGTFQAAVNYATGAGGFSLVLGDFNGDGRADLAVAGDNGVSVLLGLSAATNVGIFRYGYFWILDVDGNGALDIPPDRAFSFGGVPGDIPITGDWNGDGHTKVGIYRPSNGLFILDSNGNGVFDAGDAVYNLGVGTQAGDVPVVGDWNGDGRTKVGLFRDGYFWILDYNGNGVYEPYIDKAFPFGGVAGDVPVVGDWTGTGTSKVGVVRYGYFWILDANGNGAFDGTGPGEDYAFAFGGIPGDVPVVGDWNGDGTSKVGVFRYGYFWVLDANGNRAFDGTGPGQDLAFPFGGIAGDKPVTGKW